VPADPEAGLDLQAPKEFKAFKVTPVCRESKVRLVLRGQRVQLEAKVFRESKGLLEIQVPLEKILL
tara:strand:+ start:406 stop:603 length:198 start_codon:yes stop_codon:yes gene_type:complete